MVVRYTRQEAMRVAIAVLEDYFVELPLFFNSVNSNFEAAAVGVSDSVQSAFIEQGSESEGVKITGHGSEKSVEIEIQTETQIVQTDQQPFLIGRVPEQLIDGQKSNFERLIELLA